MLRHSVQRCKMKMKMKDNSSDGDRVCVWNRLDGARHVVG